MAMQLKTTTIKLKAVSDAAAGEDGAGEFEALVATYDVDSVGDRIVPGAFKETLAEWEAKGDPIPVIWSHMSHDPDAHIGHVLEAKETPEGLWVKAQLDLEHSKAQQVYRLLKGRRVTQFSFAYEVLEAAPAKVDGNDVLDLHKLKLYEVGPTLVGANQATDLVAVKAMVAEVLDAKAGRVLSRKSEGLVRQAHDALGELLASIASDDEDGKAKPPPAKAEAPAGGKAEEPGMSPAGVRLLAELSMLGPE